ncbi:methyltransferase domain-containing protein [Streptomyces johnsoniae]|uniref:Protein-L-isoaspartate O-methyltransferase n=1 Tax=Streptomyces johnsoniae TaxID=3075532 RepID=A0ABU2RZA6_9ACTN|nr:protein-L-isoaspartate(D-aspartate) O-methyltransferase [Streptomyces sp. DSM 41886]MDT0442062.1 protein-L-isoaspartate(D-aspartate) O-methyltransferase [Streptomyces sp. DSM 41886]
METAETRTHIADALIRVPRHVFIPDRAWAVGSGAGRGQWIDRNADPDAWWTAVYSDSVVFTQLDDGETPLTPENAAKTFAPTCSASSPILIAAFLRHLGTRPGDRVLEVGTGTGWTAGLLSHLTGNQERVTTIEVDSGLSATAGASLRRVGLAPRLVVGDGAAGFPDRAPFDRVHVTCGVRDIPHPWIRQTRPGGVIVLPHAAITRLLRLTVLDDGTATGHFGDVCSFMLMRAQRQPVSRIERTSPRIRGLEHDPTPLLHAEPGLQVLLSDVVGNIPFLAGNAGILSSGPSHATVEDGRVTQAGPRNLWDEAEKIHLAWKAHGSPGLDRIGFTVARERQYVWLDDPATPVARAFGTERRKPHE